MKNTGIIIQARTGSTRLPKKMLMKFYDDKTILQILIERIIEFNIDNLPVILATTTNKADDELAELGKMLNVDVFRGSEDDVLSRFVEAAETHCMDSMIRICADNPFFDVKGTLSLLHGYNPDKEDYKTYHLDDLRPSIKSHLGFWGELVSLRALKKVADSTDEKLYHEHVTNYIYTYPESFNISWCPCPDFLSSRLDLRFTLDTEEDFLLYKELYPQSGFSENCYDLYKLVKLVDDNPVYLTKMHQQINFNSK
ncbi:MAG: cytidylyltransferase domain-containing protein [Hyphomicrobiales bacterium]